MSTNMSSQKDRIPDVTLSSFKFINEHVPPNRTSHKTKSGEKQTGNTSQANQFPFDFRRPEAYERMAGDKPEQELAHDAAVWKLYLEEAEEHDEELVKGRHGSLDMLLLFAALFSAILTAFLIESKSLLQQDPADSSAALLLLIAQSQHRVEFGLAPPADVGIPSVPEFTPARLARWINGIWFTSLGLSLSAALLAMLGKEWLTAFLASRPRPAHTHALLRQSRLEGLEKWWALHIIALLPTLLHLSLLLFAVGLVMYLWTLDIAVAAVIASIVGATTLFYVVSAMLGAIYEFCPFVTQVSGYVRMIIVWMFGHKHAHGHTIFRYPTLKDMQALLWLANNARDPAVIDCSYQALAGLHRPPESSLDIGPVALSKSDPNDHLPPIIPLQLDEDTTLKSLLSIMIDRYEKLTTGSLHLINNPEMSAARYLNAILALAAHIRRLPDQRTAADGFGRNENGDIALSNMEPGMDSANTGLPISLSKLLTMTESLWNSDELRFRANTYASLLAAGFEIVQLVIASHFSKPTSRNRRPSDGGSFAETRSMESKDAHIIDVTPPDLNSYQEHKLHDIRAYYSRWLVRVSTLLCLHANNQITIGSWQLNKLLRSVAAAAGIDILNPPGSISTHHPQNEVSSHQTYRFVVPFGEGRDYTIRSDDLRMGPLGSLVDLLRKRPGSKDESMITTCYAALEAYAALAPVLLQQVLGLSRPELVAAFSRDNWTDAPTTDIAGMRYIAMRQALLTARYLALSRTTSRRHFKFAADVFDLMDVCMDGDDTTSFQNGSYLALAHYNNELVPILELIGQDDANLELVPGGMKFDLTNIAQVWVDNRHVTPLEYSSTPNCWPPLIRMLEKAKLPTTGVNRMLQAMIRRLRSAETSGRETVAPWDQTPAIQYLYCFTHTPYVLASLAQTGSHKKYTKAVVMGITQIVHLAAGNDPGLIVDPVELRSDAVPGFLDAASLVTKYCSGVADRNKMLLGFLVDVSQLLKIAASDSASRQFLAQHSAVLDMWGALRRIEGDESALQLATQLRAAGEQLGINFQDRKSRRSKKAKTRAAKKRYSSSDDSSGEGSGSEEEEASEDFQSKEAGTTDDDASDEEGVSNEEGSSSSSDSSSESDDDSS